MTPRPMTTLMSVGRSLVTSLLAFGVAACTASAVEVAPPRYDLYFPTGFTISPDQNYLFVLNANSDLRYSHGTLQVFDLQKIDDLIAAWEGGDKGPECEPLAARPRVLGCPLTLKGNQPAPVIVPGGVVGVGNFAAGVAVQPLQRDGAPSGVLRVFATVRGDPSVTWGDFDPATGKLECGSAGSFPRCDEAHRLARIRNDGELNPIVTEPFDIFVDELNEHVFVSHLTTGYVSLISAPLEITGRPLLQDTIRTLFAPNRLNGLLGSAGIAARQPGDPEGLVYVTSTREARVATVAVTDGPVDAKGRPTEVLVRSSSFFLDGLESSTLEGDARGITFTPGGDRAYLVVRSAPSLQIFDTTVGASGKPRNQLLGRVELCEQPARVALADFGAGPRLALPCFLNGQTWIVDPIARRVVATEDSGRGPTGVAASARRKRIYVGNYAEDTITVIDTTPGSATENRVVLRLGEPRAIEKD